MNDNNKMDRGKEHAGPKKMTPRQKQDNLSQSPQEWTIK